MMKMQTLCVSCLVSVFVAGTSTAFAITINGDINHSSGPRTFTGTGVAGGGTWNAIGASGSGPASASATNLVASDSTPTTVDFTATGANASGDIGTGDPNTLNALLDDYLWTNSDNAFAVGTFQFKDLAVGGVYDVYLYGTAGNYNQRSIFSITGYGSQTESGGSSSANTTTIFATDLGKTYVVFTNVVADANNEINGTWTANTTLLFAGPFNGFQLVSVPEPNSIITFGLGVLGLMRFVRRRRS